MTEPRTRRWFEVSLKSMFLATAVAAVFFGGYSLGDRNARREAEHREEQRNRLRQLGLGIHLYHGDSQLSLPPAASTASDTSLGDATKNADDAP